MQTFLVKSWYLLTHRASLTAVLIINFLGTVYGYYWYQGQLAATDPIFYIFVPDSPTASLFFCFALVGWILGKNFKLMEVLALITLVKYGLWAVVMNMLTLAELGSLDPDGWMLVFSHFMMAVQAVLYIPKYAFGFGHVVVGAIWTLHNDVIDYVFGQMPVYRVLSQYADKIGYFTFWLSIACIVLAYVVYNKRKHLQEF